MLFEIHASVNIMTAKFKLKRLSFKRASRNHVMLRDNVRFRLILYI